MQFYIHATGVFLGEVLLKTYFTLCALPHTERADQMRFNFTLGASHVRLITTLLTKVRKKYCKMKIPILPRAGQYVVNLSTHAHVYRLHSNYVSARSANPAFVVLCQHDVNSHVTWRLLRMRNQELLCLRLKL